MPVPHRLAEGDDIGDDVLRLEAPRVTPDSTEPDLDLVGDADRAGRAGVPICGLQITGGRLDLATTRENALGQEGARRMPLRPQILERIADVSGVLVGPIHHLPTILPAIIVRHRDRPDPRRSARAPFASELVVTAVDQPLRVAVIAALDRDDAGPAGVRASEPQRQLVRLAPGVHKEEDRERSGNELPQALGILQYPVVQVSRVRVEDGHLSLSRPDDGGMLVADVRDVVHAVQVSPA